MPTLGSLVLAMSVVSAPSASLAMNPYQVGGVGVSQHQASSSEVAATISAGPLPDLPPELESKVAELDAEAKAWAKRFAKKWKEMTKSATGTSPTKVVIWAKSLPVRRYVGYGQAKVRDADGKVIKLKMGEIVQLCPRPAEDRRYPGHRVSLQTEETEDGPRKLRWFLVAREGKSCDEPLGWIPQYSNTKGRCRNFGKLEGPTCWDFWNWKNGVKSPAETREDQCPDEVNALRRRHASLYFPRRQIGAGITKEDGLACFGTAFAGAMGGTLGRVIGSVDGELPGEGVVVSAGLSLGVGIYVGHELLGRRPRPEIVIKSTAGVTAGVLVASDSWLRATLAGTGACLIAMAWAKDNAFYECPVRRPPSS